MVQITIDQAVNKKSFSNVSHHDIYRKIHSLRPGDIIIVRKNGGDSC